MAGTAKQRARGDLAIAAQKPRARRADGLATRERILDAARATFSSQGFDGTSLRSIASSAGVDLATLKYHFGDKDLLYREVYASGQRAFASLLERFFEGAGTLDPRDDIGVRIVALSDELARFLVSHEWYARMFLFRQIERRDASDAGPDALDAAMFEAIDSGLRVLAERGMVREVDARALTLLLATGVPMLLVASRRGASWLGSPNLWEPEGIARLARVLRDVLAGVLVPGMRA